MSSLPPAHAALFHQLHASGLLLLPNVSDAGGARLVESLGAQAVATTSAGVAWSHGYADGGQLPVEVLVATVAEIARVIRVPLSVDMEGGYSDEVGVVGEHVARVVGAERWASIWKMRAEVPSCMAGKLRKRAEWAGGSAWTCL